MKPTAPIHSLILTIRDQRVILSADLAAIYGVETRALTQAVRRNANRFPPDFIFALTPAEFSALKIQGTVTGDGRAALRSQTVTLKRGQHAKFPPTAFTEHGPIMAAMAL